MSEELSDSELFLQNGLATDLIWCEIHYFIFRTLGENYKEVNNLTDENFLRHVAYLQNNSQDLALLNLARIFDRKSNRHNVRCLEVLLDECEKSGSDHFSIVTLEYYPSIEALERISEMRMEEEFLKSYPAFIEYLRTVLRSEKIKKSLKTIHHVRDKYIAHNEHVVKGENLESFWDDFAFLMNIAKLYLSIVGPLFFGTVYRHEDEVGLNKIDFNSFNQAYWIVEFLESKVGKEKVVRWWSWETI